MIVFRGTRPVFHWNTLGRRRTGSRQPVTPDQAVQSRPTEPQFVGRPLDVPVTGRQLGPEPRAVVEPWGAFVQFGQEMFGQQDRGVHQSVEAFHQRLEFPHVPTPGLTLEDRGRVLPSR